jgi:adenosylmethionine---8-amino-7-oxononanoate aminotransferase
MTINKLTAYWIAQDKKNAWHPFTDQDSWTNDDHQPLIIEKGQGVWLWDSEGNRYFDGNSSIWTNIHGHRHPIIDTAVKNQLDRIAHSSYLGLGNPRASELAEKLCNFFPENTLSRVFFSDDGSTAVECAMKMALQSRIQNSEPDRVKFIAFNNAYHGDTIGAASLGGIPLFFEKFRKFGVSVEFVSGMNQLEKIHAGNVVAVIIEPLIQGVNQMSLWSKGMLIELRKWCDEKNVYLILDEVMTGFGRTGKMFACQHEKVIPDFLCLAKGLTGGYMPLAATLTTEKIYSSFLGSSENIFYYGHSYTGNQLGCAAALGSLEVFEKEKTLKNLEVKILQFEILLANLSRKIQAIIAIRQCGMIAGIEVKKIPESLNSSSFGLGAKVCEIAKKYGLLTRPILNTVVLMPPLSVNEDELKFAINALEKAIEEACY